MFFIIAGALTFSGILFNIFGSGKRVLHYIQVSTDSIAFCLCFSVDLQEWAKQPITDANKLDGEGAHLTEAQVPPLLTHQLSDDG